MIINTNLAAQTGARLLSESTKSLNKSLARLSSGLKIVSPEDDAAGLAVSSRFDAQINRINAVTNNVSNAISFSQTQDGYLKKIAKALDRMSELTILAQDVTKSDSDRDLYNNEYSQLAAYIANAATKEFNGVPLFSATGLEVTIDSEGNTFTMDGVDLGTAAYTALATDDLSTIAGAASALTNVRAAINQLSVDRSSIGAYQTRLHYTAEQLSVSAENLAAASSRIMDVDVAAESTEYAKSNILVQSGTAMLAQANAMPNSVLRLLQQ